VSGKKQLNTMYVFTSAGKILIIINTVIYAQISSLLSEIATFKL